MPQSPTSHRNPEPITRVAAIKTFFGCSLQELKDLTPGPPPDFYKDNPGMISVTRSMRGFRAEVADWDQCSCCPETPLFNTGWYATEQAALVRLGIVIQEALEEQAAAYFDQMCEAIGRTREAIAGA